MSMVRVERSNESYANTMLQKRNGSRTAQDDEHRNASPTSTTAPGAWERWLPVPYLTGRRALAYVLLAALGAYAFSYDGAFVFDDNEAILTNHDVIGTERKVWQVFQNDFWGNRLNSSTSHKSYRPLTILSFRIQRWLAGDLVSMHYHLVNIFLHALVCLLFYVLTALILADRPAHQACSPLDLFNQKAALTCALLFAVHPIHSESVSGVVGRADLLCAAAFLISTILYIQSCHSVSGESIRALVSSIAVCVVAVLFKEQGITSIGVCCAYDVIVASRVHFWTILQPRSAVDDRMYAPDTNANHPTIKKLPPPVKAIWPTNAFFLRQLVLLVGGLFIIVARWRIMGSETPTFQPMDNPHSFVNGTALRMLNYNYIYAMNAVLLLWPYWLCFDWSMGCVPVLTWFDARLVVVLLFWALGALLALTVIQMRPSKLHRLLCLSIALIVIPFLPASNIFFRVGFVIAERNLYLPSMGYCMVLTIGLAQLTAKYRRYHKRFAVVFYTVLALFMLQSARRSIMWRKEVTLFQSGLSVCPLNAKVHYNVGKISGDLGNIDRAIAEYQEALRLHPDYDQPMNNLANLYKDQGRVTEAERLLERAVIVSPNFAAAWMNLGIAQASLQKYSEAESSYKTALTKRHNYPDCYYNLGNLYLDMKQYQLALAAWTNATALKPTHTSAWSNTVILLESLKRYEEAEIVALEALRHLPLSAMLYHQLANVYGVQDKYDKSERNFLRAVQLGETSQYHANLGILYHRWGKFAKAIFQYKRAISLDPTNHNAKKYLDVLVKKMQIKS